MTDETKKKVYELILKLEVVGRTLNDSLFTEMAADLKEMMGIVESKKGGT